MDMDHDDAIFERMPASAPSHEPEARARHAGGHHGHDLPAAAGGDLYDFAHAPSSAGPTSPTPSPMSTPTATNRIDHAYERARSAGRGQPALPPSAAPGLM